MAEQVTSSALKDSSGSKISGGSKGVNASYHHGGLAATAAYEDVDRLLAQIIEYRALDADSAQLWGVV